MPFLFCVISILPWIDLEISPQAEANLDFVTIDVFAQDAEGNPVSDLTPRDFVLRENGKKIVPDWIRLVNAQSSPVETAGNGDITPPEYLIFVTELIPGALEAMNEAFVQMQTLLEGLGRDSGYKVFIFSMDHGPITPNFTADPIQALQYLNRYRGRMVETWGAEGSLPGELGFQELEERLQECFNDNLIQIAARDHTDGYLNCLEFYHDRFARLQQKRGRAVLKALGHLLASLENLDGFKHMFFVSPGFALYPGKSSAAMAREFYGVTQDRDRIPQIDPSVQSVAPTSRSGFSKKGRASDSSNTSGTFGLNRSRRQSKDGFRFKIRPLLNDFRHVAHQAMVARVSLHTIQLDREEQHRGSKNIHFSTSAGPGNLDLIYAGYEQDLHEGMDTLARFSGGLFFDRADAERLKRSLTQQRIFYEVGYRPSLKGKRVYREVTLKCRRKGIKLHYRGGYFPSLNP